MGPGPGRPSKAELTAKQLEADALEAQLTAEHVQVIESALKNWHAGNTAPLKDLKDRHWGLPTQKIEVQFTEVQLTLNANLVGIHFPVGSEVTPDAITGFLTALGEAIASPSQALLSVPSTLALTSSQEPEP